MLQQFVESIIIRDMVSLRVYMGVQGTWEGEMIGTRKKENPANNYGDFSM